MISQLFTAIWIFSCFSSAYPNSDAQADVAWLRAKEAKHEAATFTSSRIHVLRLSPQEDLLDSLWRYSRAKNISAATIISCVGSVATANIRYADQEAGSSLEGPFEIVSLVGNIDLQRSNSPDYSGDGHVHISCSDSTGTTSGGHLLTGTLIYTTAEITLLEIVDGLFERKLDDGPTGSGYYELKVYEI